MEIITTELDPRAEPADLVQDVPHTAVMLPAPVVVQGPVRVQELPRTSSGMHTVTVGTTPKRVLTADPRRAKALLVSRTADMYFGGSQAEALGGYGAWWPLGTVLPLHHCDEVWISAVSGTTDITVITESWSG